MQTLTGNQIDVKNIDFGRAEYFCCVRHGLIEDIFYIDINTFASYVEGAMLKGEDINKEKPDYAMSDPIAGFVKVRISAFVIVDFNNMSSGHNRIKSKYEEAVLKHKSKRQNA